MSDIICGSCGLKLAYSSRFCSSCGLEVTQHETSAPNMAPGLAANSASETSESQSAPSVTKGDTRNLARIAQVVALLGFILPWMTVSCSGRELGSISGLNLLLGKVSLINPVTGAIETHSGSPDVLIVLAFGMLLLAFFHGFRSAGAGNTSKPDGERTIPPRNRRAILILSGMALALMLYKVEVAAAKEAAEATRKAGGFAVVAIEATIGFWITCAAVGAAMVLYGMTRTAPAISSDCDGEASPIGKPEREGIN